MNNKLREAARMALEAYNRRDYEFGKYMEALHAALAEQQEPLTFETAAEAKADREHAEAYYRQAEHLLTADERTLHAEIARLKAQLAEQPAEQEPVAWQRRLRLRETVRTFPQQSVWADWIPCTEKAAQEYAKAEDEQWEYEARALYTAPRPRKRLTDNEIEALLVNWPEDGIAFIDFARAIESTIWSKT
jgi:hypothetical protein